LWSIAIVRLFSNSNVGKMQVAVLVRLSITKTGILHEFFRDTEEAIWSMSQLLKRFIPLCTGNFTHRC
jgi:hypothetical protein